MFLPTTERDGATLGELKGQVAVITGASSGIGRATALMLAQAGARVCVGARRLEPLEELVQDIRAQKGEAIAVQTDVTSREQVRGRGWSIIVETNVTSKEQVRGRGCLSSIIVETDVTSKEQVRGEGGLSLCRRTSLDENRLGGEGGLSLCRRTSLAENRLGGEGGLSL